jgi:hypothetical protein
VAAVDATSGAVTGVSIGTAIIEATVAGKAASGTVHVGVPTDRDGSWLGSARGIAFSIELGYVTLFRMVGYSVGTSPNGGAGGACASQFDEKPFVPLRGDIVGFYYYALGGMGPQLGVSSVTSRVDISFANGGASGEVFLGAPLWCPATNSSILGGFDIIEFTAQREQ